MITIFDSHMMDASIHDTKRFIEDSNNVGPRALRERLTYNEMQELIRMAAENAIRAYCATYDQKVNRS
jgi:hypothetical protein